MNEKVMTQDHDYSLESVPEKEKKPFLAMFVVMLGFTFFSSSMWTGGSLGTSVDTKTFALAVFGGNAILATYAAFLAWIASDTGLTTHLLAKYAFGEKGSHIVSFLLGITQVGWFGVGVAMFAIPVHKVTGINLYILLGISGLLMTGTAYFGMKALTILSMIAVPSIAVLGGYSVFTAVDSVGGMAGYLGLDTVNTITFTTAITMCVGSFISGATLTPDFTRYSKTKKIGIVSTVIAFALGNSLMFLFGAVGAKVTGFSDISDVMIAQGLIIPAIVILGFNIWTTNDNAIYASGLAFSSITKVPKNKIVIVNGLVATVGSMFLYNNFVSWLTLLGSIFPSIGAIIIADYFIVHKRKYVDFNGSKFGAFNGIAVTALIIGIVLAQLLPGIPPINGIIGAFVGYVALNKIVGSKYSIRTCEIEG